jgi:inward rectifier potassium channel|mmetsp:Transcript_123726/g.194075  ORF Transcript_123726/g.194075 Transcript_123726/m.194075 type:complete len:382 (-) Transcript_123726:9-1154(-)
MVGYYCFLALIGCTAGIESLDQRHVASLRAVGLNWQHNSSQQAVVIKSTPHHHVEQVWLMAFLFFGGLFLVSLMFFHKNSKTQIKVPHQIQEDIANVNMYLKNESPDFMDAFVYYLMNTSWAVLGMIFFEIYLLIAAFFAVLLMLQPNTLTVDSLPVRFMDAFNFSVQTLATIGYGALSPASDWAHSVVIVESYVGLIIDCVGGGILFSRMNRPTSRLIFSNVVVVSQNTKGQTEISMRMLNQRLKSSWLDVNASISALVLDGQVRALRQLKLRREWTPILHGAWMLTHTIDESSPLAGLISANEVNDKVMALVVFVKGVEATYDQHLHAHCVYYTNQFRFDQRFADLFEFRDDGIVVDAKLLSATEDRSSEDTSSHVYFH